MNIFSVLSWIAVVFLPLGYWRQIWHIHKHKEVRDLNLGSYIFFAISYLFLGIEAYAIDSTVFLMKNILVIIPTGVLIYQIKVHSEDKWVGGDYKKIEEAQSCPKVKYMHKRINIKKALN